MQLEHRDPAERNAFLKLCYRDWRPTRFGRVLTHALAWISGLGMLPSILVTLQVKGRRSGKLRSSILVSPSYNGERYLVSMLGENSDWVRNVRAAGGEGFIKRWSAQPVRLLEVPVAERAPILRLYCQVATSGREHFPLSPDAPLAEFAAIADRYPAFRIAEA
jgi:hypothetical protein